jgi:hypothetical protein
MGQRAREWLEKHWRSPQECPICQSQDWAIQDVVELKVFTTGMGITLGGPMYVMFPVMCRVCKYTLLFNAVAAGVVPQQAQVRMDARTTLTAGPTVSGPDEAGAGESQ